MTYIFFILFLFCIVSSRQHRTLSHLAKHGDYSKHEIDFLQFLLSQMSKEEENEFSYLYSNCIGYNRMLSPGAFYFTPSEYAEYKGQHEKCKSQIVNLSSI